LLTQGIAECVGPDGDVLAIDSSVDALEELRANTAAPNVSYFVGCADILPLMDESVDAVLTRLVLIFDHDKTEAVGELFRVLGSGGRISIYGGSDEPIPNFDRGDLEQVFTSAGFNDVRTDAAWPAVYFTGVKP
jgi:ubiquinone/menaquinone biosynthesis C-methylase UbiE